MITEGSCNVANIDLSVLARLDVCDEAMEWIGSRSYEYTPAGVQCAIDAGAKPEWLEWLFKETRCGDAEMWRLAGTRVITEDAEVTSGVAVCLAGSPAITVSGGWVGVFGNAKPTITVSGGEVRVYDNAKPTITVSRGGVDVSDNAEPVVTVSRGLVHVYGNAKPVVRRENGSEIEPVAGSYGRRIYRI